MTGFRDIIGQDMTLAHLKGAVHTGKVAHAYIFDGEKGMGKNMLSSVFVKALLCEEDPGRREDHEPCGKCHSCIMAESGSHPDIITVTHEKPNSISVNEIRAQVVNDSVIKPYSSPRKVYIIPEAGLMTHQAQNALLKTLEEPPEYVVIILLADNKDMLLPTLISRSVCLSMRPVSNKTVSRYLQEKKGITDRETMTAVSFAQGNLGKAERLLEDEDFNGLWTEMRKLLTGIRDMNDADIFAAAAKAGEYKDRRKDILSMLMLWFRDVLFFKAGGKEEELIFSGESEEIEKAAGYYSYERINSIIETVKDAGSKLESNVNAKYTYELLFIRMK